MDDDMEEETDVVELAPSPIKVSKSIDLIWDDDKIEKYTDSSGDKFWRCLWCNCTFKHWNATKALLHVHKVTGSNIHKCKSRSIDDAHKALYARLYEKGIARKNAHKQAQETKKRKSEEYITDAAVAYAATQRRKPPPSTNTSNSSTPNVVDDTPPNQMQSLLNFPNDGKHDNKSTRYHQQTLTETMEPKTENELTMAPIADLIHSCGLPFSLASHDKFRRVLQLAKAATKKYVPPGRNKIAGDLLDLNYDLYIKRTCASLIKEADVYGLSFFGDAATVKKSPLINILASSVHLPVGCLRIVDCTGHLEADGRKDASYIAELFLPHISEVENKVPRCTDLIIFDGASNIQKAGSLLEAQYPHISVLHGAEHVVSLFYHDVFKLHQFHVLKNINRLIYHYFGSGSMHTPYAIFSKHSREHNNGKPIGLIRAADTRMGGHVISMLRTLRLKDPLINTISSAPFLQGKFHIDKRIIDMLKRDSTWEFMRTFIRAVFPMLIVLRLADKKDPVMDKLFYSVRQMDITLEKSKALLDEMEPRIQGHTWRFLKDITDKSLTDINEDMAETSDDDDSMFSDEGADVGGSIKKSLGQQVKDIWMKRRAKLISDFAIAGWLLSPIPDIYTDSASNQTAEHRDAVDRLLHKMLGSEYADDSNELAEIMNTFWDEYEQFKAKTGPFSKPYIWSAQNNDLKEGKSHLWHKKTLTFRLKYLGNLLVEFAPRLLVWDLLNEIGVTSSISNLKKDHI